MQNTWVIPSYTMCIWVHIPSVLVTLLHFFRGMTNEEAETYDETCVTENKHDFGDGLFLWAWRFLWFFFLLIAASSISFYYLFFSCSYILALSQNPCWELRTTTTGHSVKWWLPYPGDPAALTSNYMNDNWKILEATWKSVYAPDMTCLFTY